MSRHASSYTTHRCPPLGSSSADSIHADAQVISTEIRVAFSVTRDRSRETIGKVGSTCSVYNGKVVTLMPHTHKLSQGFTVDLLKTDGTAERVLDDGAFDAQSHIQVFDPQLDLSGVSQMKFECTFNNTTNHDVVYGIGENAMCVLFGYLYPPHSQFVAYSDYQGKPCNSIQIGAFH